MLPLTLFSIASGPGFFTSAVSRSALNQSQVTLTSLFNAVPLSSTVLQASLGPISATSLTSASLAPAAHVDALLVTQTPIRSDSPFANAIFRVHDSAFNVACQGSVIQATLTPSFSGSIVTGSCIPASSTGLCTVTFTIPATWFSMGVNGTAAVAYALVGVLGSTSLGSVTIVADPVVPSVVGAIMHLPLHDLYVGSSFTATVFAYTGAFSVNTFRMVISTVVGQVNITDVTFNGVVWGASVLVVSSNEVVITASPANPTTRPVSALAPEQIFQVQMTVLSSANVDVPAVVTCSVIDLFDAKGNAAYSATPTSATFYDRYGSNSMSGRVFVANNGVIGILPFAAQSEFVNTAVLSGQNLQAAITVLGIQADTTQITVSSGLTCASSNSSVIQVGATCNNVFLNGTETAGAPSSNVVVYYGTLNAKIAFRIWYPDAPLSWSVSDALLSPIGGYMNATTGCSQIFQSGTINAQATFRINSTAQFSADVTALIQGRLQSNNTSVAFIVPGSPVVSGVGVGTALITVSGARSAVFGGVVVAVNAQAVYPTVLIVTPVQSITISNVPAQASAHGSFTAAASISQALTLVSQTAYVYATAVLSDGMQMALSTATGLVLASLDNTVVQVSGQNIVPINSGYGVFVDAQWQGGVCNNVTLIEGHGIVNITLPTPIGAEIVVSASRITAASDSAVLLSIPTQSTLTVNLVFADGHRQDVTNDSHTVYNDVVLNPNNIVRLMRFANNLPYIVATGAAGSGSVFVNFTNFNVSASVAFQVVLVAAGSIASSPMPMFSGSDAINDVNMDLIGQTGVYQQLYIRFTLTLTDGTMQRVDASSSSSYQTRLTGTTTPATSTVSFGSGTSKNVMTRLAVGSPGRVDVVGTFNNVIVSNALTITVTTTKLVIIGIDSLSFPTTLEGVVGATSQPTFGITLSDSSQWTSSSLFTGTSISLSNLVAYSTSNPLAASVNATTGVVTLLGNDNVLNALTVTSLDSGGFKVTALFAPNLDPTVGDVDIGLASGLALVPAVLGQTFSASVRINVGGYVLRSAQVKIVFDASKLSAISVVQGSQWPGGPFAANLDTAGVASFGGASNSVSGLFEVAVVTFQVIGVGTGAIGGTVVTLADDNGDPIPSTGTIGAFVAGHVAIVLTATRRRSLTNPSQEAMAVQPAERVRRSGEVACANKPCAVCSAGRQTGDTNGDCLFDVRDVSYSLKFLNFLAWNPFNSSISVNAAQLSNLDADKNGVINTQDVDYLLKVNFGLYNFFSNISVQPVSLTGGSCVLSVTMNVFGGGADAGDHPADPATTFVYVDIESTNSILTSELASSVVETGTKTGVSKGTGYNGSLLRAQALGNGVYGVVIASAIVLENIGLSLLLGTTDIEGYGSNARTTPLLTGSPAQPFEYNHAASFSLVVSANTTVSIDSTGYSPLMHFNNTVSSLQCNVAHPCNATTYQTAAATITSLPVCNTTRVCQFNEYESMPPTPTSDRVCLTIQSCNSTKQYETAEPTSTSDRVCENLTVCFDHMQYVLWNATYGGSALNLSVPALQYQAMPPTATSDRNCTNLTACVIGQYVSVPASPTSDQICACLSRMCLIFSFDCF